MDSILTSIKKLLGVVEDDDHFDLDIITHINSVFSTLHQLGVGPSEGFSIEDKSSVWTDFLPTADLAKINSVRTYMYIQVKLLFDPPTNSGVLKSYENLIEKFEWRLNVTAESKKKVGEGIPNG